MNFTELFELLRNQKYVLYVPERIYRAHRDGLLRGWGANWHKQYRLFDLLEAQDVSFRIPFRNTNDIDTHKKWIVERCADRIVLYEKVEECPPFPEAVVTSDKFWDSFLERFGLQRKAVTNKLLAAGNGWVYRVRFFTLWASCARVGSDRWMHNLPAAERREIRNANRILRKDYGLTSDYCNTRVATLVVLKKAYPPEQVRHVRRQLEENLRKNPAEAIRYALERGLVK